MRISDWSSDVCSSDLPLLHGSRDGLDGRKAERLSRGKLPIEASLDLHGLRQAEAHRRLEAFLAESQAAGKRCVLVVTGKGLHKEEGGVLRSAVPRWLNERSEEHTSELQSLMRSS